MLLGFAGLLPAAAAALALLFGPAQWHGLAATVCATYDAVILSFLGGAWWGIASGPDAAPGRGLAGVLAVSVLPSLAGWAALLLDRGSGLVALGLLFLVVLPGDFWLERGGLAPAWWTRLRVPLSVGMAALALLAAGVVQRE